MGSQRVLSDILLRNGPRMVSFVGAGGKTGLMLALARELALEKGPSSVLVTTTTHMRKDELPSDLRPVRYRNKGMEEELKDIWRDGGIPVVHSKDEGKGRLKGIGRKAVTGLWRKGLTVLVEADGAKRLPIKRLRPHEPVIPMAPLPALVCVVVGFDALGRPLGKDTCFNHDGVIKKGVATKGETLDPGSIRGILYRKRGYPDVIPEGQEGILMINKVDKGTLDQGVLLGRELYHQRFRSVLVTTTKGRTACTEVSNMEDRVHGLILAAGTSKRFGRSKLLEKVGKETILEKVVGQALGFEGFDRVVLVLGHDHEVLRDRLGTLKQDPRLSVIDNLDHEAGMSTSMRAGVEMSSTLGCDAVMFLLADMPNIDKGLMGKVMDRYRSSCCTICIPVFGGGRGHPVIIRKDLFPELLEVTGDIGARDVITRNLDRALTVDIGKDGKDLDPGEDSQMDIDRRRDLVRYEKVRRKRRVGR